MKVLFVCTGNTCRSCMAEVIFNQMSDIENLKAYSAGISVIPQSKTSRNTASLIKKEFNIDISERNALQLTEKIISESDLILTMTEYMKEILLNTLPKYDNKIYALSQFVGGKKDVIDPYGGEIDTYKITFCELKGYVDLLMNKLKEDNGY